ncbi:hypothetical protein Cgig2_010084 [Carnegiea gigantea]|uniref:Response regulatory domain-containing protein n=1 Tax=Carnegiea gigantea TaxID=171969 RepID=A0A9Q1K6A1_9CARY|nr:hypothetical protein Cgig2_010084 [Carnegiea gigantea]
MEGEGSSCSSYACISRMEFGEEFHVLAVDDNLIDRKLVERLLKNSSCKGATCRESLRNKPLYALLSWYSVLHDLGLSELISESKVNLILTDYCMPGMTGYDLLKKIKESSHMREVPVVIMSSENVPTRINKCLEEGAQTFMLKPLKLSDIKKLRRQVIRSRK